MQQRIKEVSLWLQEKDTAFSMFTSTPNVFYLSGFYTEPHERLLALFIFPNEEPFLVCPQMEVAQARTAGWEYEIIGYSDTDNPWEKIEIASFYILIIYCYSCSQLTMTICLFQS